MAKTKTYVEFLFPGILVLGTEAFPVENRDAEITPPSGCLGYRFFDRLEETIGGETLIGEEKNYSPTVYFGEEYSIERVRKDFPTEYVLIGNMENNHIHRAVRTYRGNWLFLRDNDTVTNFPE